MKQTSSLVAEPDIGDVTDLLRRWSSGSQEAAEKLLPLIYKELRRMAGSYARWERPGHTLQATALVHEAYVELASQKRVLYENRLHFFELAATLMRRILVNHARERAAKKRGGGVRPLSFDEAGEVGVEKSEELLRLDDALSDLATEQPFIARIVELRYFAGLENREIAELLEISIPTIVRKWRFAKAWLYRRLSKKEPTPGE